MRVYSDPSRANETYALPDIEVFHMSRKDILEYGPDSCWYDEDGKPREPGWYYWACFPGCLPDSDPIGPFASEADAVADAQEN